MITNILLFLILIVLSLDFYIKNHKIELEEEEKIIKKPKWSFGIHNKGVWEKVVDDLNKELN